VMDPVRPVTGTLPLAILSKASTLVIADKGNLSLVLGLSAVEPAVYGLRLLVSFSASS